MADVFISYAREDLERVRPIVGAIADAGYSVFWDRTIPAGMTWRQYIGSALDEAKCVIVVWSKSSIDSNWVQEEADDGLKRKILIPVTIDEVVPPLGFRAIQHENFRDWKGDPQDQSVTSLLKSIERIIGKAPRQSQPMDRARQQAPPTPAPTPPTPIQTEKKPASKHKTNFFFKLGPMVLSLTVAAVALTVGLNIWFGDPRGPSTSLQPESAAVAPQAGSENKEERPPIASKSRTSEAPSQKDPQMEGSIPKFLTNGIGMKFVLIPAGNFMMGGNQHDHEQPIHRVTIRKPFYMQNTEVTQGQWRKVMGKNPSYFENCGDDCPVEQVSWDDVGQFVAKLNQMEEGEYRLPSEAEWDYAARSGGREETYAGGENIDELGWYSKNSKSTTHPVGQLDPNGLGLYDMSGNVWEWVEDDWHASYDGAPGDGRAWVDDPRGAGRVIRGGG